MRCGRILGLAITRGILLAARKWVETMRDDQTQQVSEWSADRPIRVVYCGTPAFAVPALRALAADARFDVGLVVTQPDRAAGRGRKLVMPAVKEAGLDLGLAVYQPERLRTEAARQSLVDADADVFVVAAYGVIFGNKTLAIPGFGCLNLHASILPAYRGANPIAAAIADRAPTTGVTLMKMEAGLDTGPIIGVSKIDIIDGDTTESLTSRLAVASADLATGMIPKWLTGRIEATPQPVGATLTRPMTKADGWLDWKRPAVELEAQVRAMWPWPRAWTTLVGSDGQTRTIQVHRSRAVEIRDEGRLESGTVIELDGKPVVIAGYGGLELTLVQEAGGRSQDGSIVLASGRIRVGTLLGQAGTPEERSPLVAPDPEQGGPA